MKARPFKMVNGIQINCNAEEAEYINIRIPCPVKTRNLPVSIKGIRKDTPNWTGNGDINFPTLRPSILTTVEKPYGLFVCHCFVTNGKVQFLSDCTHVNVNKILDLIDIDL